MKLQEHTSFTNVTWRVPGHMFGPRVGHLGAIWKSCRCLPEASWEPFGTSKTFYGRAIQHRSQRLTIQPQNFIFQPGPAECAKPLKSAAPRMGVQGVLDFTDGVTEVAESQHAHQQDAEDG